MFTVEKRRAKALRKGPQMSTVEVGVLIGILTKNLSFTWAGKLLSLYVGAYPDLMDDHYRYPEECWPELARHLGTRNTDLFWGAVVTSSIFEVDIDDNGKRYFFSPVIRRYHEALDNALEQYLTVEQTKKEGKKVEKNSDISAEKAAEKSASASPPTPLAINNLPKFPSCAGGLEEDKERDKDKESPIPVSGVIEHTGDPSADIRKALESLRMSDWLTDQLIEEFKVPAEYVSMAIEYLIRQPLTQHFIRSKNKDGKGLKFDTFFRLDYFEGWVRNLMRSGCGKSYLEEAAKHALSEKDRNAGSLIRPDIFDYRPVSPFEWQDRTSGKRYYQDAQNGIVTIPDTALPRPSDDVSWHVNKRIWYRRK